MSNEPTAPRPRVFRDGDTVPAGVCVLFKLGVVGYLDDTEYCDGDCDRQDNLCENHSYDVTNRNWGPFVEVIPPDYDAAVAADEAVRKTAR